MNKFFVVATITCLFTFSLTKMNAQVNHLKSIKMLAKSASEAPASETNFAQHATFQSEYFRNALPKDYHKVTGQTLGKNATEHIISSINTFVLKTNHDPANRARLVNKIKATVTQQKAKSKHLTKAQAAKFVEEVKKRVANYMKNHHKLAQKTAIAILLKHDIMNDFKAVSGKTLREYDAMKFGHACQHYIDHTKQTPHDLDELHAAILNTINSPKAFHEPPMLNESQTHQFIDRIQKQIAHYRNTHKLAQKKAASLVLLPLIQKDYKTISGKTLGEHDASVFGLACQHYISHTKHTAHDLTELDNVLKHHINAPKLSHLPPMLNPAQTKTFLFKIKEQVSDYIKKHH